MLISTGYLFKIVYSRHMVTLNKSLVFLEKYICWNFSGEILTKQIHKLQLHISKNCNFGN